MSKEQHRHDVSDQTWAKIEPHFPGQRGQWGGIAKDNRRFFNGVCWILRTGAPWRDLPEDYGKFVSVKLRRTQAHRPTDYSQLWQVVLLYDNY